MPNPRSILITGASSGIGEALALFYAAPGVNLVLSGRDQARLDNVCAACRARGATVVGRVVDVTDRTAMAEWIVAADQADPFDLVIANAGISGGTGGEGEDEAQARLILEVNVFGVLNTIWPVLPTMKARGMGQIAVVASLAGYTGWPGAPAYSAGKGCIRLYAEALRGSLRGSGVGVHVICPGFVATRMTAVNNYKMPFMVTSDRAAEIIAGGLRKGRGRIIFPHATFILAGLISLLPLSISHLFLTKLPQKPAIGVGVVPKGIRD